MPELSILEIIKYAVQTLINSKVFILLILELAILAILLIFSRLMDKKVVKTTSIIASLVVLGFYITSYIDTLMTFINNVSSRLIELIYFPTTLEFVLIMIASFIIMGITWARKNNKIIKVINSILPFTISFLFLCIIEYINNNNIPFDEFSVFTNPVLMSLYELAMGLFITWVIGLIIYEIDKFIINKVSLKEDVQNLNLVTVKLPEEKEEEVIEMPRLKNNLVK